MTPTPHVCPVCQGSGKRFPGFVRPDPCPACKGACVLWEPEPRVTWEDLKAEMQRVCPGSNVYRNMDGRCRECGSMSEGTHFKPAPPPPSETRHEAKP